MRRRRRYFIGELDPCASIEFSRGCPWDCSFCSAWTFYGRSYRKASPEAAAEELASIREPNVFIAFLYFYLYTLPYLPPAGVPLRGPCTASTRHGPPVT